MTLFIQPVLTNPNLRYFGLLFTDRRQVGALFQQQPRSALPWLPAGPEDETGSLKV